MMETEQSPSLDVLAKLGFKVVKPPMLQQRPLHARQVASGWHAGMAILLTGLAIAAWLGWLYHERSQSWS
jgi:hypothetical protein